MVTGGAKKDFGSWGEEQAVSFLVRHGFAIVDRNYYIRGGEIDIVATARGGEYYFIEVKTRWAGPFANDWAITKIKLRRLQRAINHYAYARRISYERSWLIAGLLVIVESKTRQVAFRLAVFH